MIETAAVTEPVRRCGVFSLRASRGVESFRSHAEILVTGRAGFIGSNLTLKLQETYPAARIVVVDDLRSGDSRNLQGLRGDFITADSSRIDWKALFSERVFAPFPPSRHQRYRHPVPANARQTSKPYFQPDYFDDLYSFASRTPKQT